MRLVLNIVKIAKGGFSCAAIEETQFLNKIPCTDVREENKLVDVFPGHKKVKAVIERHLAMLRQNQTRGYFPCQNGNDNNLQTFRRRKGKGSPPPNRRRQQTPELTPEPTLEPNSPVSGTPPIAIGNTSGAQRLEIINLAASYAYSHTSYPCAESFTLAASAQDSQHDTDFNPDMLIDEGRTTG
jgi:hypothetical protein